MDTCFPVQNTQIFPFHYSTLTNHTKTPPEKTPAVFRKRKENMGAVLMDGKAVSAKVKEQVAEEIAILKDKGISSKLAVVIVGDDPASKVYVNNKEKGCAEAARKLIAEWISR